LLTNWGVAGVRPTRAIKISTGSGSGRDLTWNVAGSVASLFDSDHRADKTTLVNIATDKRTVDLWMSVDFIFKAAFCKLK
jgi:hypothetical protein